MEIDNPKSLKQLTFNPAGVTVSDFEPCYLPMGISCSVPHAASVLSIVDGKLPPTCLYGQHRQIYPSGRIRSGAYILSGFCPDVPFFTTDGSTMTGTFQT